MNIYAEICMNLLIETLKKKKHFEGRTFSDAMNNYS